MYNYIEIRTNDLIRFCFDFDSMEENLLQDILAELIEFSYTKVYKESVHFDNWIAKNIGNKNPDDASLIKTLYFSEYCLLNMAGLIETMLLSVKKDRELLK